MSTIRRSPPAHEQAMWPDELPATMTVRAGFTLYVPADLDLSETDLTIHGTVTLPPAPPAAASEAEAGLVELATQAEVDAGTDALRAVTPATLAVALGALPDPPPSVTFNECEFTVGGTDSNSTRTVTLALALDGVAVTTRCGLTAAVLNATVEAGPHAVVKLGAGSGTPWYPDGVVGNLWIGMSESDGTLALNMINNNASAQTARLAVIMPTGSVLISDAINLGAFVP